MSKDKCPDIFSHQMEATAFIVLQIFFCITRCFENLGISLGYCPVLSGDYSVK